MVAHPKKPQSTLSHKLEQALHRGVSDKIFSGAQAAWCIGDAPSQSVVAGHTAYENGRPINENTLFDIASLTKLFTATVALILVDQQKLSLSQPIWSTFTLEQLLAHETGLPAWKPFFESVALEKRGTPEAYDTIVRAILTEPATALPSKDAIYSDLGYIGLGHQLSKLTDQPLTELVQTLITTPLGLKHTMHRIVTNASSTASTASTVFSVETAQTAEIAATEQCPWRKKRLQGEVHDDNAWTMGGAAGHAGLFSTALDMVHFGRAWRKATNSDGIVSRALANRAICRRASGRGLGFDLKTPGASSVGNTASDQTFGHLGFTGTSLWIDPTRDAVICLLTNRVHPSRDNNKIRQFRPHFHELFFNELSD